MSGMKEFLKKKQNRISAWDSKKRSFELIGKEYVFVDDLFVFLWERGGKEFAQDCVEYEYEYEDFKPIAESELIKSGGIGNRLIAQDFLDCVAIDEERVKELIKELEAKE